MRMVVLEISIQHYDEVFAFWQDSEGLGLSDVDSKEGIARFLDRNPGLSFIARDAEHLTGAILCGSDGRGGYIYHLAVSKSYRRKRVGRALVERCLSALRRKGIRKCHIFVLRNNYNGIAFWKNMEWAERVELVMMSKDIEKHT